MPRFGLINDTYFCTRCVDCCLYSTTFMRGDNPMPACPLGKEPSWVQVAHPWIIRRLAFILSKLQDGLFDLMIEEGDKRHSAVMEPDPWRCDCGNKVQFRGDVLCAECKVRIFGNK